MKDLNEFVSFKREVDEWGESYTDHILGQFYDERGALMEKKIPISELPLPKINERIYKLRDKILSQKSERINKSVELNAFPKASIHEEDIIGKYRISATVTATSITGRITKKEWATVGEDGESPDGMNWWTNSTKKEEIYIDAHDGKYNKLLEAMKARLLKHQPELIERQNKIDELKKEIETLDKEIELETKELENLLESVEVAPWLEALTEVYPSEPITTKNRMAEMVVVALRKINA